MGLEGTVQGFFTEIHEGASINELDLLAAIYGRPEFVRFSRQRRLILVTYRSVTEKKVRNLTSRSPRFLRHLHTLRYLGDAHCVSNARGHIHYVINLWASLHSLIRESTSTWKQLTSNLILKYRFEVPYYYGDGHPPPVCGIWCPQKLFPPQPAFLPAWNGILAILGRVFLLSPSWSA